MNHRLNTYPWLLLLAQTLITLSAINSPGFHRVETLLEDWRIRLLSTHSQNIDGRIVLIDIDDLSLTQQGRWPWPRQRIAELIEQLQAHRPALIGIDILFPEHTPDSATLARALQAPNVTTSLVWQSGHIPPIGTWPGSITCSNCDSLPQARSWISNPAPLAAGEQAHITPVTDGDGTIRRLHPLVCHQDSCIETLALSLARQLLHTSPHYTLDPHHRLYDSSQSLRLTLEPDGSLRIPWYDSKGSQIAWVSAHDVLSGNLPDSALRGRILIIGSSAVGLHDRISTPLAASYPALEVHARVLQALLDQTSWAAPAYSSHLAWLLAWLVWIPVAYCLRRQWLLRGLALSLCIHLLWLGWVIAQQSKGVFWPLLPVWSLQLSTLVIMLPVLALDLRRTRDILRRQFSHYVAPQVLSRLQHNPQQLIGAQPERRVMTVLFADLRSFSAWAQNMPPDELAATLQIIMDRLTQVIHRHGGTVDKYIGDAVMAFWGAPLEDHEHAHHALLAAIELCREMDKMAHTPGMPALQLSVGINSGDVVVGELGSSHRCSYTLIGAPVNLAAHLEAATRRTPYPILAGDTTHSLCPDLAWQTAIEMDMQSAPTPITVWPLDPFQQHPQATVTTHHDTI